MRLDLPTSPCRRCGAPIVWITTETNHKGMPIDPESSPTGNVFLRMENGRVLGHVILKSEPRPNQPAFVAHFATCIALNPERMGNRGNAKRPSKPKPEHEQGSLL